MSVTLWQSHVARGKHVYSPVSQPKPSYDCFGCQHVEWKRRTCLETSQLLSVVAPYKTCWQNFLLRRRALAFRLESHYFKLSYASASSQQLFAQDHKRKNEMQLWKHASYHCQPVVSLAHGGVTSQTTAADNSQAKSV